VYAPNLTHAGGPSENTSCVHAATPIAGTYGTNGVLNPFVGSFRLSKRLNEHVTHTAQTPAAMAQNKYKSAFPFPKLHARCDAPNATQLATSAPALRVAADLALTPPPSTPSSSSSSSPGAGE
jgi:hypothetical protein